MRIFFTALAMVFAASFAQAATQDFVVDWGNSSVTLTDQSSGGNICSATDCSVSVDLWGAPTAFSLGEGESETFDFLRWTGTGTTGNCVWIFCWPDDRDFEVSATLAFSDPTSAGSSSGSGGAHLLLGFITAGNLSWTPSNQEIVASNGAVYDLSFEGGAGWLLDGDAGYTSSATVKLISAPAPVPLPAAGLLLVGVLGGLGLIGRRKAG